MTRRKIRVLIVDDSAMVRRLASEALSSDPGIEVVGTAADPYDARDRLKELKPDVMTLDLEMPRMDGLTFLRWLMEQQPMPVVVVSSMTARGSDFAIEALRLGAVDVLGKPAGPYSFASLERELIEKVRIAAGARPLRGLDLPSRPAPLAGGTDGHASQRSFHPRSLILLGASTGGTEALAAVLSDLPPDLPPIAIVQHIPARFSRSFTERLNRICRIPVGQAIDGEPLRRGTATVGPGDFHFRLRWINGEYVAGVSDGPAIWNQRPAVDVLFKSAAECGAGPHAVAGLLTGMGRDGAQGMLELRQKDAVTFVQDEASCVVYGMPRAAWELGAAQKHVSLSTIAGHISNSVTDIAGPLAMQPNHR